MSNGPWTDEENDLIVADYFAMLADDIAGHRYNKAEHRRVLLPLLNERSEGSIEFKHQNISAVLKGLGEDWIPGYKPAFNFQMTLVDAVARWLALNPAWFGRYSGTGAPTGLAEAEPIWIGPPPTLSNQPPPQELEQMLHIARKFDVAARDERNRTLGRAGEERVLAHERAALRSAGRDDLARKVRWVSEEDGDGAGYDIASFVPDGRPRLIEVKTTNGWERTPFHISRNELAVAEERRAEWSLFRLWNFAREPNTITLTAPYAVTSGDGLLVGSIFGIASGDGAIAEPVETALTGVFDITKVGSQAWTVGAKVYWDDTNKRTTSVATSNTLIGVVTEAVAGGAGDTIGRVRLNGAF